MSKRRLLSPPLPPQKRLRDHKTVVEKSLTDVPGPLPFHGSLYDELILCIFSHLSWVDLCTAQATSRNWSRLATDNELWRNLYLKTFGRLRLRGGRGAGYRFNDPTHPSRHDVTDWKWMFRISSNWRKGRCAMERLHAPPSEAAQFCDYTHILLAGPLIISASSRPSVSPWICLSGVGNADHRLHCPTNEPGLRRIVALVQDQSHPTSESVRIAVFLHTGEFNIFHVDYMDPTSSRLEMTHTSSTRSSRTLSIFPTAYHHPVLITLSDTFSLSIYDLSTGTARLAQALVSYSSYPPTSLVLSAPTPETYKLVLTYSVPVYPDHWSIGVSELIISNPRCAETSRCSVIRPMSVISTRTIRAFDVPEGWVDESKLRVMQEQWGRKVSRVADTQSDGKWVILAPADKALPAMLQSDTSLSRTLEVPNIYSPTSLQLYRLSLPSPSPSVSAPRPKLTFVRSLHGQSVPVLSLAVADGRCVSLGVDGSIWVWDLETGASTEVFSAGSEVPETAGDARFTTGAVAFDERRIVTARGNDVMIRRFDV